jgi:hypothetical protein
MPRDDVREPDGGPPTDPGVGRALEPLAALLLALAERARRPGKPFHDERGSAPGDEGGGAGA